jgi:hypothetical protein
MARGGLIADLPSFIAVRAAIRTSGHRRCKARPVSELSVADAYGRFASREGRGSSECYQRSDLRAERPVNSPPLFMPLPRSSGQLLDGPCEIVAIWLSRISPA